MIYKRIIFLFFIIFLLIPLIHTEAGETYKIEQKTDYQVLHKKNNLIYYNKYNDKLVSYDVKPKDENISLLRRFEIVFFISLPLSIGFSFGGLVGYRAISGTRGSFSNIEYMYLALSSVGISLSISFNDYLQMKKIRIE